MQALARETNLSETVFVLPPEQGGHARIRIFTPTTELPFAGHPDARLRVRPRWAAPALEIRLETARASSRCCSSARARGSSSAGCSSRCRRWKPFRDTEELFAALGVEGAEAPVEVYDNGIRHMLRRPRLARAGGGAAAGLPAPGRDHRDRLREQLLRRRGRRVEDADVRARRAASTRTRRRARPPGPLAVHLARHGRIGVRRRDQDRAGRRDRPARRCCTRGSTARADAVERVEVGGSAVVVARGEFRL